MNIKSQLLDLGLDEKEAEVYELLLKTGSCTISQLLKLTKIKKGDLYNVLYRLVDKNLIEKKDNLFTAFNPEYLLSLLQKEKEAVINKENLIEGLLPKLNDLYQNSSAEILSKIYNEKLEIKKKILNILQSNKRKFFLFSDLDLFKEYFFNNLEKLNRSKCQVLFSLEIKKDDLNNVKKFFKQIKNFSKNIELAFLTIDSNFTENIFSIDKEIFLLKKSQNLLALELLSPDFSDLYWKQFNYIFKNSFNLKDLEEVLALANQTIVLKEDNLFSKKFFQKNKKLLTDNLREKLNLLK